MSAAFSHSGRLLAVADFGINAVSLFSSAPPTPPEIRASLARQLTPRRSPATIPTLLAKRGYGLVFHALTAGTEVIDWYSTADHHAPKPTLIAAGHGHATGAGIVQIAIGLTPTGQRLLRDARRLTVTVRSSFTPTAKAPVRAGAEITLTRRGRQRNALQRDRFRPAERRPVGLDRALTQEHACPTCGVDVALMVRHQ